MESLFEALYAYALKNSFDIYALRDERERRENEKMVRLAMEELTNQGMGDAVQRIQDGTATLNCLDRRCAFWAGLTMGLELNRL